MRKQSTTKESVLKTAVELLQSSPDQFNLRLLAQHCQISVGTIYNYFHDKDQLMVQAVAQIWRQILSAPCEEQDSLSTFIYKLMHHLQLQHHTNSLFFLSHGKKMTSFGRSEGKHQMKTFQNQLVASIRTLLQQDPTIQIPPELTLDQWADFIFSLILGRCLQQNFNAQSLILALDRIFKSK